MNCKEIIKEYLVQNGFDGLHNEAECGCELDDLIPCHENCSQCQPGYKIVPPSNVDCDYDFYICEDKEDRPWEI